MGSRFTNAIAMEPAGAGQAGRAANQPAVINRAAWPAWPTGSLLASVIASQRISHLVTHCPSLDAASDATAANAA